MKRILYCFFFFFSSRRRHTISLCDWSSDVCLPISASRAGQVNAPEIVVLELELRRAPEGGDRYAEWPGGVEHPTDRAVLARRVGALKNDQKRSLALRIEPVLEPIDL